MKTPNVKNKASKVSNWAIVSFMSMVILGFAAKGVMQYINGMTREQKIMASVFVVSLIAYVIYTNLKKALK